MTKKFLSAFLLIAGFVTACSAQPEHGSVGAVLGQQHWSLPAGMTNPATADAGLLAAVGDIYTAADGTAITQAKARIVLTGFLSKLLPFN